MSREVRPLESKVDMKIEKQAANELYPPLVASADVEMSYDLGDPHFYRSVLHTSQYKYYLFGYALTALFVLSYLVKVTCSLP